MPVANPIRVNLPKALVRTGFSVLYTWLLFDSIPYRDQIPGYGLIRNILLLAPFAAPYLFDFSSWFNFVNISHNINPTLSRTAESEPDTEAQKAILSAVGARIETLTVEELIEALEELPLSATTDLLIERLIQANSKGISVKQMENLFDYVSDTRTQDGLIELYVQTKGAAKFSQTEITTLNGSITSTASSDRLLENWIQGARAKLTLTDFFKVLDQIVSTQIAQRLIRDLSQKEFAQVPVSEIVKLAQRMETEQASDAILLGYYKSNQATLTPQDFNRLRSELQTDLRLYQLEKRRLLSPAGANITVQKFEETLQDISSDHRKLLLIQIYAETHPDLGVTSLDQLLMSIEEVRSDRDVELIINICNRVVARDVNRPRAKDVEHDFLKAALVARSRP